MGLNKIELDKVVAFVKKVKELPGNEEFISDLRKVLMEKTEPKASTSSDESHKAVVTEGVLSEKIDTIEKYLGLDYQLDKAIVPIDYSFVTDKDIRNQLESDYREMLRYRYGTRGHKVDFFEFCRYVHLQSEQLLNYYYYDIKHNGNSKALEKYFKSKYNTKNESKSDNQPKDEVTITYYTYYNLLDDFYNNEYYNPTRITLDKVREIRNGQSHRKLKKLDFEELINKAHSFASRYGVKLNNTYHTFSKNDFENNPQLNALFIETFNMKLSKYHKFVNVEKFIYDTPYDEIIRALYKLVEDILKR